MRLVKIDKIKCINCGLCAAICPEAFEITGNNETVVKNPLGNVDPAKLEEAKNSCPTAAIGD